MSPGPFSADDIRMSLNLLGLDENADLPTVAARRRALAGRAHPDRGGTHVEMTEVNRAADLLIAWLRDPDRRRLDPSAESSTVSPVTNRSSTRRPEESSPNEESSRNGHSSRSEESSRNEGSRWRVDRPSFVVEALPVVAHEALLVAAAVLGRVCDDDPPYAIEAFIGDADEIWCRLELVPDAGSTTVSIVSDSDPEELIAMWCDAVNELGLPD